MKHGRAPWLPLLCISAVLPVSGWIFTQAQQIFRSDLASVAERTQVARWLTTERDPPSVEQWTDARAAIQSSLDITPGDPALHEAMGDLYSVAGRRDWNNATLRFEYFSKAAAHYESAIGLRPTAPGPWVALATARQAMGSPKAAVHSSWSKAIALGPYEEHLQPMFLQVVLADWKGATPDMQKWAKALFDKSPQQGRAQINNMARIYGLKFSPDDAAGR